MQGIYISAKPKEGRRPGRYELIWEIPNKMAYDYYKLLLIRRLSHIYTKFAGIKPHALNVPITVYSPEQATAVDRYWNEYTVNSLPFTTTYESMKYYQWLIKSYPLLDQLMDFPRDRSGQVILDYGCGPGNDIFRFLILNNAVKVIGMDVSYKALELARQRLALYDVDPVRLELIQGADSLESLPVESESIDHINCAGVLHHTSDPGRILNEFFRVLRRGGTGNIMVYNQDSIAFHLNVAYVYMIILNKWSGLSVKAAFARSTDGENCPISRCYIPGEFMALCNNAGFEVSYMGGYFNTSELYWLNKYTRRALLDTRLATEHREFLRKLEYDMKGYPIFAGKYAGWAGVYRIIRTS
jgi:SAM-dependent methyltransferase